MRSRLSAWMVDVRAGLNAAVIGIPQEINYGLLAFGAVGLSFAVYGVFAAFCASALGTLLYCLLGGGVNQVLGPRPTLIVLLTGFFSALLGSGMSSSELPATLVLAMGLVGLVLIGAARLGLGDLFKYLPYPVLAGFTNGVAATLVLSALPMALGASFSAGREAGSFEWRMASVVLTATTVFLCLYPLTVGRFRQVPAVLQALLAASLVQSLLHRYVPLELGPTVGDLLGEVLAPETFFAAIAWPELTAGQWPIIGKFVLAIAMAAALETLATTVRLETERNRQSPGNEVLHRLGLTYLLIAPVMMPVAASLGRSVALSGSGGRTRAAQLFYAFLLVALGAFAYPLIARLPQAAIAGILIVVARNMVGDTVGRSLASIRRSTSAVDRGRHMADLAVMMLVVAITVLDGFMTAMAVGIVAAMGLFIRDQSRAVVRGVSDGGLTRSLRVRSPVARELQSAYGREIVIVEAEGALFFGSMDKLIARIDCVGHGARSLVLDLRRVTDIDQTACLLLKQSIRRCRDSACQFLLAAIPGNGNVYRMLRAHGVNRELPEGQWFATLDLALECAENDLLKRHGLQWDALLQVALADSDLAAGLDAVQIPLLESYLTPRRLVAGELLFRQGDPGDSLFVIRRGAISIKLDVGRHSVKRLIAFGPGALFGEMALATGAPRSASAVADDDSELLVLSREQFIRLQSAHPEMAVGVLRQIAVLLSERLRSTTGQLQRAQS